MMKFKTVGKSVTRYDGLEKVTGKAKFAQDYRYDDMVYGATLRSTVPHANFTLDISDAQSSEGVLYVFTAKDVPGKNEHGVILKDLEVLNESKVRKIGDPLAFVVAETEKQAKEAVKKITVTYDELPGVFDPREAMKESAPKVHDGVDNLIITLNIDKGEVNFDDCEYVVENEYHTPMVDHAFLQPESAIGYMDGKQVVVLCSTQYPHWDRFELSEALGIEEEYIRILNANVGGAFGGREDITSQIHVAMAALKVKRPVKVTYDREESFLAHSKRHPMYIKMKLGCDKSGKLLAMENEIVSDSGAYASWVMNVTRKAMTHSTGPYEIPNVKCRAYGVYTNNPFTGAMRGFGATQATVAYESMMDELAEVVGLDPLDMRRRNALRVGSITGTNQVMFNSVPLIECIDIIDSKMDELKAKPKTPGVLTGYGVASSWYGTGYGNGFPDVSNNIASITEDGRIQIACGFTEVGQGAKTVMTQIAAEVFGVTSKDIVLINEDTDNMPDSGTSAASRQTYNSGNAIRISCQNLHQKIVLLAQKELGLNNSIGLDVADHKVSLKTFPDKFVTLKELVEKYKEELLQQDSFTAQTTQLDALGHGAPYWPYGYNTLAVKVEIDPLSGRIDVVDGVFAQDVGRAINPRLVEGQMDGGFVMGLGYALYEDIQLVNGEMRNRKFSNYILPTSKDMPTIEKIIVEDPEETGPFGAKGIGETTTLPVAPAILNAIYDACGIRFKQLPVTPIAFMKEYGKR